jgi:hypothetical protein
MDEPTLFTVEKANRALPLVRRIMDDVVAAHAAWRDLVAQYEVAAANARPEWGESARQIALRVEVDAVAARISGYVAELEQIGCHIKGFEPGLVDFYGRYEGRLVCLCWKHGESAVTHWHERDTGFAGRRPITPEFEAEVAEAGA